MNRRILLTGGARSGKSTAAEMLVRNAAAVTYVATAPPAPTDPEWLARVALHRSRRPAAWTTVETTDIVGQIGRATPNHPVLVDCLTLWLMARMDARDAWDDPDSAAPGVRSDIDAVARAVADSSGGLVLVTNEVGSGIVPNNAGSRLFRDLLGQANSTLACQCDDVYLVVAGQFLRLDRRPL